MPKTAKALADASAEEKITYTVEALRTTLLRSCGSNHDQQALVDAFVDVFAARLRRSGWPRWPDQPPSPVQMFGVRGADRHPQEIVAIVSDIAREAMRFPWSRLTLALWGAES